MKLHEAQETGIPKPCINCGKPYQLPYGRWGDGGTCSKKCEAIQEAKPRHPDHPERNPDDLSQVRGGDKP